MKAELAGTPGVRLPISYKETIAACRQLGAVAPTEAMASAMFAQARTRLGFVPLVRTAADSARMTTVDFTLRFHAGVEKQLAAAGHEKGALAAGAWKYWLLHPRLVERGAVNYGRSAGIRGAAHGFRSPMPRGSHIVAASPEAPRMRISTFLTASLLSTLAGLSQLGCDGGDTGPGGAGGTGGSGATGGSGGATTTAMQGGGGTGGSTSTGGATGGPFTSQGTSVYETQTSLAADGEGGVVATWIAFDSDNTSGIGYAVSRDGGEHWTEPKIIDSPGDRLASNPVVVADKRGRFTLAWLGFKVDFQNPDEHIYVSRLDEATEEFGAPVVASDDDGGTTYDLDKPSLAVDATDALLLTWADFTGSGQGAPASTRFARSADGETFARVTVTNDATFGNLASLCLDTSAGAGATLYMVHLGAGGTVALRTSVNQGQSWELRQTPATSAVFQDITCAVKGTELHIAYASGAAVFTPGEDSPGDAVQIMRSSNGGTSFDAPVTVSDGPAGDQYLYPKLVRAPSGDLEIVYYQGKVDADATFVLASSADGQAWTTSPVAAAGTFTLDRTIASWLGAYVGFAIPADLGLVSYADNSSNKAHIAFAKIALP